MKSNEKPESRSSARKDEATPLAPSTTGKPRTTRRVDRDPDGPIAKPGRRAVAKKPLADGAAQVLAAIVQSSDAAIIGKTLDGIVTSWNSSAEAIFGYSEAEMVGKPIHVLAAPGRPDEMGQILDRVRQGQRVEHYETERVRKDGRIIQVSLTVSPIRDATGSIVGASKIVHDITNRKRTEEQLQEFAHALDLAPAMVRSLDGRIILWGRTLQALYGWTADEAIGRISHELLATEFPIPLPDIMARLLETGEWQGELAHRHRDGRRVVVASQWALHRDAAGQPVSVLKLDWDMTEARRTQAMIVEREARLRSIVDTAPDAIITIDDHGLIQSFSAAAEKLFGYVAGEVIGHNVNVLMPNPHRENHDAYLERYRRTGEKRIIGIGRQVEARRKDGTIFPMQLSVGEAKFGDSRIFSGFITDLTARVKMEADLRQAQKMEAIGQLTGGVAHDFNNLLTVISGNLEMLEPRLKDAGQLELLTEAREATQLGADLASRLLAFGRRQPLQPKPIDVSELVRGMTDLLRRSLGEMVEIALNLGEKLPTIMADAGQIENALLNLAVNARDAMPKGGRLVIETARAEIDADDAAAYDIPPGRYVNLAVTDTGSGMAPEVRQRAFEPFYTTKGPGAGSGLGLSMIYGFVKQSGGHVQLYSELGHGTTVRIYLPAQEADGAAAMRPEAAAVETPTGETVLVVEDDPRVRRVSVRRLRELGYGVIEADSGPAALEVISGGQPIDLLFTDIVMAGGMTGVELAEEVRRRRPALKILFTSGYAEPAVIRGGLSTTNAGWLGKPHSIAELRAKIRELLGR